LGNRAGEQKKPSEGLKPSLSKYFWKKRIFFKVEISDFYFKNATSPFFFLRFVKKRLSSTMFLLLFPCSFSRGVHDYSSTF